MGHALIPVSGRDAFTSTVLLPLVPTVLRIRSGGDRATEQLLPRVRALCCLHTRHYLAHPAAPHGRHGACGALLCLKPEPFPGAHIQVGESPHSGSPALCPRSSAAVQPGFWGTVPAPLSPFPPRQQSLDAWTCRAETLGRGAGRGHWARALGTGMGILGIPLAWICPPQPAGPRHWAQASWRGPSSPDTPPPTCWAKTLGRGALGILRGSLQPGHAPLTCWAETLGRDTGHRHRHPGGGISPVQTCPLVTGASEHHSTCRDPPLLSQPHSFLSSLGVWGCSWDQGWPTMASKWWPRNLCWNYQE